jgi:sensor histidine kinase YesM
MLFSLALKLLFPCWLFLVIIPRFAARRRLSMLLIELILSLILFVSLELAFLNLFSGTTHLHNHFNGIFLSLLIYVIILSVCLAVFFTREWVAHEKMKRELIETQLTTELNFLKSQINPHFLFNTLNNLFAMAQQAGNDKLATGVFKLSGLMRYVIYDSSVSKVPLEKEIAYINDFIGLSKLRFTEDELKVVFTVDGNVKDALITPMILIPFVENAFKHGVKIENPSLINISLSVAAGTITFECTNTLYHILRQTEGQPGIGLENVKRRLDLCYPGKHRLEIINTGESYKIHLVLTA